MRLCLIPYLTQLIPECVSAKNTCHITLPPSATVCSPDLLPTGVLNKSALAARETSTSSCLRSHKATAGCENITPVTFPNSMRPGLEGPRAWSWACCNSQLPPGITFFLPEVSGGGRGLWSFSSTAFLPQDPSVIAPLGIYSFLS